MAYCDIAPSFYTERLVTARKPHRCCETGRMIQPGERYWRITAKWEDRPTTLAQSRAAYHFARWLNIGGGAPWIGECIHFGGVAEFVAEWGEPAVTEEWERVKRGEITRTT